MCLVARHLEAHGITTLCLASALDIMRAGNPPRTVFVDYPLGHSAGKPFDADDQVAVVREALLGLERMRRPGDVVTLDRRWSTDDAWQRKASDAAAGDLRQARDTTPRYQTEADRRLAEAGAAR